MATNLDSVFRLDQTFCRPDENRRGLLKEAPLATLCSSVPPPDSEAKLFTATTYGQQGRTHQHTGQGTVHRTCERWHLRKLRGPGMGGYGYVRFDFE